MIYRKTPPQPPRLLLRVVAVGAGAALVAACSSSFTGSVVNTDRSDGAVDQPDAEYDDVVVGVAPCADGGCGLMSNPDAGDGGDADANVDADSGTDAGDSGLLGVIAMDSGAD